MEDFYLKFLAFALPSSLVWVFFFFFLNLRIKTFLLTCELLVEREIGFEYWLTSKFPVVASGLWLPHLKQRLVELKSDFYDPHLPAA
jgi:hypothetical protein